MSDSISRQYTVSATLSPPVPYRVEEDSDAALAMGRRQLATGQFGLALETFRSVLRRNPRSAAAQNGLGVAYAKIGRADLARRHFEHALAAEPANTAFARNLARLGGDAPGQVATVAVAASISSNDTRATPTAFKPADAYRPGLQRASLRGVEWVTTPGGHPEPRKAERKRSRATNEVVQSTTFRPVSEAVRPVLAQLIREAGSPPQQPAVSEDDNPLGIVEASEPSGFFAQVDAAIGAGRIDQARAMLTWANNDAVTDQPAPYWLAVARLSIADGRVDDAALALAKAKLPRGADCAADSIAITLADKNGALVDALSLAAVSIAHCPSGWWDWNRLGVLLAKAGYHDIAERAFDVAIKQGGERAVVLNNKANSLAEAGRADVAIPLLERAIALAPDSRLYARNLAIANGIAGNEPIRRAGEDDADWSGRLARTADGARRARNRPLEERLVAAALIASPKSEPGLWRQWMALQRTSLGS